jgi:hypothetical protein
MPPEIYRNNGPVWTHVKTTAGLFVGFLYRKEKAYFSYILLLFNKQPGFIWNWEYSLNVRQAKKNMGFF